LIRHCEQSEAIQLFDSARLSGLPRFARNDEALDLLSASLAPPLIEAKQT